MKNKFQTLLLLLALTTFGSSVLAQQPKSTTAKRRVQLINFEDELVRGNAEVPSAETLFVRDEFNFKKMIKLRQNFVPEASRAVEVMNGK